MPDQRYKRGRRRRMDEFKLGEVSFVDRPAQTSALADIQKNDALGTAIAKASEYLLVKDRAQSRALAKLGEDIAKTIGEPRSTMTALVRMADERLKDLIDGLVETTGASRAQAEAAMGSTPLGDQLLRIKELASEMLLVSEAATDLIAAADARKQMQILKRLRNSVDQLPFNDDQVDVLAAIEAGIGKLKRGQDLPVDWLPNIQRSASQLTKGNHTMTNSTPLDVLEKVERDQFGNVKDPAQALASMRKASKPEHQIEVGGATAQLDTLAKAFATENNVDFYTAYDAVADENPGLVAQAVCE